MSKAKLGSRFVAIGALLMSASTAFAGDSNGSWQVRAGVTGILFDDKVTSLRSSTAGDLKAAPFNADASLPNIVVPTATITYFFNKNWAVEGICCAAHVKAVGTKGALNGAGNVTEAWVLPPVVTLQYRFDRIAGFQPYVGAGIQWIHYWPGKGDNALGASSVAIEDSVGPALQAGLDYDLGRGWSLDLDVKKAWVDTTVSWRDTTALGTVKADVELNPWWVTASLAYRFNTDELLGRRSDLVSLK